MNVFDFNYYDGSLFAAGLAVAAVVKFGRARRVMAAASVPLFLSVLLLLFETRVKGAFVLLVLVWLLSLVLGMAGFCLTFSCDDAEDRRHAAVATLLLASPFLLLLFSVWLGLR
ncbi:MAG TPA: hypothetical protein VGV38_20155 [Pyrinomonadaceae bacterium]|nr:hypothetical protein [Pyrinomonadaceae bacterium]